MTARLKTTIIPGAMDPERERIAQERDGSKSWLRWGPYLSERQWGTVREDYGESGNPWDYFTHDMARSRSYRWGEDGIGGISDDRQILCLAIALWNRRDPILKERLFGLTGDEGNHGEDVKEIYAYLDGTPTNSYLRMVYLYPQQPFPYTALVEGNRARSRNEPELELIDTRILDGNRYFEVVIEYAKQSEDDIGGRITVHNRGPEPANLDVIPQLWFRNRWSWNPGAYRPRIILSGRSLIAADQELGKFALTFDGNPDPIFCDNETNVRRLWGIDAPGHFKDGINDFIVGGMVDAINRANEGTKAGLRYQLAIGPEASSTISFRLAPAASDPAEVGALLERRRDEADRFHATLSERLPDGARIVQRQAFAGLIWSRQFYSYDVARWLDGDPGQPEPPASRHHGRNNGWRDLAVEGIYLAPDNWEYPFVAAWDLAFHAVAFAAIDPDSSKAQLLQLLGEGSMNPSGQVPGTEWELGDPNPPLQAWAAWQVFETERRTSGDGDLRFLQRVFPRLCANFDWWQARRSQSRGGSLPGGFLGLDNISFFDRSASLPAGRWLEQVDANAWLAMFSLNLLRIVMELPRSSENEALASRFAQEFLDAAETLGESGSLWSSKDRFFYDLLHDDGESRPLSVRSIEGIIPLFATECFDRSLLDWVPALANRLERFAGISRDGDAEGRIVLSILDTGRLRSILERLLSEKELLSPHGIRSLSREHLEHPAALETSFGQFAIPYEPGEAASGSLGRNSNWRGPIWLPLNYLLIESLRKLQLAHGEAFRVDCPTGSNTACTLDQVAVELRRRITSLFLEESGHAQLEARPAGSTVALSFPEYFHGDSGKGLGAAHQTGWTALVALLLNQASRP